MHSELRIIADQQIPFVHEAFGCAGKVETLNGYEIDAAVAANADALLVRAVTRIDEKLLQGSAIQFVGSATSGIDHVDLDYLEKNNIDFVYAPGANARSVAEYVLSCLYILKETKSKLLEETTVGIIGCGKIGSILHSFLTTLGIDCLLNDPPLKDKTNDKKYCELEQIFQADVISLHVPLTFEGRYATSNMIGADFLSSCKPDAALINTSRGGVINEQALIENLQSHVAFTAILDVWQNEPYINPELLEKVMLGTPHIAGYSFDGKVAATKVLQQGFLEQQAAHLPALSPPAAGENKLFIEDTNQDIVQCSVLSGYDVRRDSAALKGLLQTDKDKAGRVFDELRKNYPQRREFTSKTIVSNRAHSQEKVLKDLGFKVVCGD